MTQKPIYRVQLAPDAAVEVEPSGNVVLVTPERRITVTHVARWMFELGNAQTIAGGVR